LLIQSARIVNLNIIFGNAIGLRSYQVHRDSPGGE